MLAIAVDLLCERYTATYFNDRSEPEWPPHPARLFSAMTAAWADADEPDPVERDALAWLERQLPPDISFSPAHRRAVVTHFVPVNDVTALTRNVSRNFGLVEQARSKLTAAERDGDARAVQRAAKGLRDAQAKALADGRKAGLATGPESAPVMAGVLAVLPENRGKQGRTYPSFIPDDSTFCFAWRDATPSESQLLALDGLLARVGRLGHSSTLVSCRVTTTAPPPTWTSDPDGGEQKLRVLREGLLDRLETAYKLHQGSEPRTLPAAMISYGPAVTKRLARTAPLLGGDWFILGIQNRPLRVARALDIARATRSALLAHCDKPIPFLSGHEPAAGADRPTPPTDRPHLAIVPMPSAGHRYSDGSVSGIALVVPLAPSDEEILALEQALSNWAAAGFKLAIPSRIGQPEIRKLEDLGVDRAGGNRPAWLYSDMSARRRTLTREYWCRPARRWLTVTPIALDRFPGQLRTGSQQARERAEAEAEVSVARACDLAGLPADPRVTIRLDAPLTGIPAVPAVGRRDGGVGPHRQFPGFRTGRGTPRVCVHAEIEFSERVRGPVLIGAGRYFGYGLCLPSDAKSEA